MRSADPRALPVLLLALATGGALTGCSPVAPVPEDHYYRLVEGARGAPLAAPVLAGLLYVDTIRAAGVRRDRHLLYSRPPHVRFRQYDYHHWEESPPRMIRHRLVEALGQREVAEAVTDVPGQGARYRLGGYLERFERLVDDGGATALLQLHLVLQQAGAPAPVLDRIYRHEEPAAGSDMEATALAFSRALDQVLADLVADLEAL